MTIKFTADQQLGLLERHVVDHLQVIADGYDYDPGDSDLDDEQPIFVRMTLGDYRKMGSLLHELKKPH